MAPKDLYLYAHSYMQLLRLNLSKLRDGDCQFELLVKGFRDMKYPAGMGLMRVNSKLYMVGGFFAPWHGKENLCLGAYLVDPTNEEIPLVPDVSFPKFFAPKLFPTVVTIKGKTYVFTRPCYAPVGRSFEVFDHSTLNWKPMEDPPLFKTEHGAYFYFAWGHKIVIHNCRRFSIFDTKKLLWEDGDSFFERWVNDGRPLPTGTAAEIEEGLYIAMSLYLDAVVVYECDPDDGLLRSHQVLEDFSDLISRDQVSPSVPSRLPVHLKCFECFDVKGDRELPLESILVMPDWSKKRAADYTESDALFDEVIINGAETGIGVVSVIADGRLQFESPDQSLTKGDFTLHVEVQAILTNVHFGIGATQLTQLQLGTQQGENGRATKMKVQLQLLLMSKM
ncbi:hypothetical protein Vadar_014888 [Vaccinium darrowii]|uniref:Uncharacterized protein n=1 Tax=Vaccinium darrowii TaxID=229202 RepID=A0ACB7ZBU3_9ERIC|nr:hypothetical protein Vadar_014888 [Vaccinium darrowii]